MIVTLYVAGKPVGTLADAERVLTQSVQDGRTVEFRDAARGTVGTFTPNPGPTGKTPLEHRLEEEYRAFRWAEGQRPGGASAG